MLKIINTGLQISTGKPLFSDITELAISWELAFKCNVVDNLTTRTLWPLSV